MYALASGNTVIYSNGTKETVKKKSTNQKPRKKAIKVGLTVMAHFNPKAVGVVVAKLENGWFEVEFPNGQKAGFDKKLLVVV